MRRFPDLILHLRIINCLFGNRWPGSFFAVFFLGGCDINASSINTDNARKKSVFIHFTYEMEGRILFEGCSAKQQRFEDIGSDSY